MNRLALAFSLSLVCTSAALADSPLPPPWDYDLQTGQYVIHGDVKANKLVVRKMIKGAPVALWGNLASGSSRAELCPCPRTAKAWCATSVR